MNFAHGAFTWDWTEALNTTHAITGLGFSPKAIRCYYSGISSATDASTDTVSLNRGVSFSTPSFNIRIGVNSFDQDNTASMQCQTAFFQGAAMRAQGGTTAGITARLDISSFDADGFTFKTVVTPATGGPQTITIFWEAWGGEDITRVSVNAIAEPAATGNVDYVVTGAAFTPDVVMFAGCQSTGVINTTARSDSGFCVGFASSGAAADNVVVLGNNDDGSASADTDGYCKTGECLAMITTAGGNPNARAQLTQFNADGFRLNWIARGVTDRRYISMSIKGGRWQAGSYTINGSSGGATATVSGLTFTPIGMCLIGRMTTEQAAGTSTIQDRIGLGTGTSPSDRKTQGMLSEDATANSEIDLTIQYAQVLAFPSTTGTLQSAYDINSIDTGGFQIIVDTAGGVASEWQGYLTFGTVGRIFKLAGDGGGLAGPQRGLAA